MLLVLGCVVTAGCASGGSTQSPVFGSGLPAAPVTPELRSLEHRMSELVNRDRKKNHLPPLAYDERLADAARSHSSDMQQHHFFDHDSPTFGKLEHRLTRAGYVYITSRENLAEAPSIEEAEQGLLRSPHHYENLMAEDVTSIGIGIVRGGPTDARNLTVTQIFATPGKKESEGEANQVVERRIQSERTAHGMGALPRLHQLDALAQLHLDKVQADLTEGNLRPVAKAIAESLARTPISKVNRVSVGGQVVVDSGQFLPQGAVMDVAAKGYGMAVRIGKDPAGARRLKVLLLVGL